MTSWHEREHIPAKVALFLIFLNKVRYPFSFRLLKTLFLIYKHVHFSSHALLSDSIQYLRRKWTKYTFPSSNAHRSNFNLICLRLVDTWVLVDEEDNILKIVISILNNFVRTGFENKYWTFKNSGLVVVQCQGIAACAYSKNHIIWCIVQVWFIVQYLTSWIVVLLWVVFW